MHDSLDQRASRLPLCPMIANTTSTLSMLVSNDYSLSDRILYLICKTSRSFLMAQPCNSSRSFYFGISLILLTHSTFLSVGTLLLPAMERVSWMDWEARSNDSSIKRFLPESHARIRVIFSFLLGQRQAL